MLNELLSHGSQNALSASEIEGITGLSPRELRHVAERERLAGHIILSGNGGYFLPNEDPILAQMEITVWMAERTAQAGSILRSVEMAREALREYTEG